MKEELQKMLLVAHYSNDEKNMQDAMEIISEAYPQPETNDDPDYCAYDCTMAYLEWLDTKVEENLVQKLFDTDDEHFIDPGYDEDDQMIEEYEQWVEDESTAISLQLIGYNEATHKDAEHVFKTHDTFTWDDLGFGEDS